MARSKRSFEDSVVYDDLRYWGYYKGRQCAADGYAPKSAIADIVLGSGGGIPGHRVLVLDMTPRAWQINARVMCLPTDYIAALVGRFCLPVKQETGQPYTGEEVADAIGISTKLYWARLAAGRALYRSIIFSAGYSIASESGVISQAAILSAAI